MSLITTYWSLGSNIDPEKHIEFAVSSFRQHFGEIVLSKLYRSPAVGFSGEDFLNLAIAVNTDKPLEDLLVFADSLEQQAGRIRVRRGRFDSRTLDVDLLMYGELEGVHCGRQLPADDMLDAAHVLKPMVDIAPTVRHPGSGRSFRSIWNEFDQESSALIQLDSSW